MTRAIGIDLGTTFTVVATIEEGRPVLIPNAEGQLLTPSVVALARGQEPLVGHYAKLQAAVHPEATALSIKRHMGSHYRVSPGEPLLPYDGYTPEEISSFILRKVKADAERYLGQGVDQAVITVPAHFNDHQRQATREAGMLAGFEVLRIINEPTAAALAYGLHQEEVETILVWDLGGGTFDISILELGGGVFEVQAVSGDSWLGGDDFDQRVVDYLIGEYERRYGVPLPAGREVRQKLREVAEQAKIQLSSASAVQARLPWPETSGVNQVEIALDREQLELLSADLLQRMVFPTQRALADAGLTPGQIDRVILVGGATRMPAVRSLARELLGQEPYRYIDPDTVVARGAAIQAGMLLGLVKKVALLDVLPLSLGVATQGGLMARIIGRNTPLPASETRIFATAGDGQTSMDIRVLQGERELDGDNILLGQFQLDGIPAAPRGAAKVEVAFEADVDGILHISAQELLSGSEVKVTLTAAKLLDQQEIDGLVEEARQLAPRDQEQRQDIEARIEAQNLIAAAEGLLSQRGLPPDDLQVQQATQALTSLQQALAGRLPGGLKTHARVLRRLLATICQAMPTNSQPLTHQ